jgi:hypothetical protein
VPPEVHYPDLTPPSGWHSAIQGLQVRLVPPGATIADSDVVIIVSPLVPRQPLLPSPADLIEEAIFAESRQRLEVVAHKGPTADRTLSGLAGVAVELQAFVRPFSAPERRIYAMYADNVCYYAVSYLAREATFAAHVAAFWATARSIRPFRGRVLHPTGPSPLAVLYSD